MAENGSLSQITWRKNVARQPPEDSDTAQPIAGFD
jgi:hypothetical protein